ncbi:THUMP domain-containing protein 3 [Liparis tanakae]|uniref:THUMP domain-containing protein 3 n=1 Tax=Liparis tanakae TaxID=230148 RepID=A0A4Z2J853_9TELE|nr:THUMP domain-containing protein 3 [Liparis tanakae]
MSSQETGAAEPGPDSVGPSTCSSIMNDAITGDVFTVTIGATVPTGFEHTAAEEVNEKIGVDARIGKDRGRIYFPIATDKLFQVHLLKSVDNLFVVVEEDDFYQFKESKEDTLMDMQLLASKLPWTNALEVWKLNATLKKKKGYRKKGKGPKVIPNSEPMDATVAEAEQQEVPQAATAAENQTTAESTAEKETSTQDSEEAEPEAKLIKFRVTCNRAGDKHSFTSNEAARDFGGGVQDFFQWKADMTKFDIEVLLNIHKEEVVIGIALTEESLHRRNISHFGPTTLRSTLCYGMLSTASGLPIDTVQWDLCNLPIRTGSVDIVITDMPFGKRIGSRKKNWDLYPPCLREMARVCTPGTGKAVLLTQDKKCFTKAVSRMGGLWKKLHTVWVNVGGLHAGVYLLKRTEGVFGQTPEDVYESRETVHGEGDEKGAEELS